MPFCTHLFDTQFMFQSNVKLCVLLFSLLYTAAFVTNANNQFVLNVYIICTVCRGNEICLSFDVGRFLQVEIFFSYDRITSTTSGPIEPAAGLGNYVEILVRKPETEFNLCGVRGGGNAAAIRLSLVLAFESDRERNAAIMLAIQYAFGCNIMLSGLDDKAPAGS